MLCSFQSRYAYIYILSSSVKCDSVTDAASVLTQQAVGVKHGSLATVSQDALKLRLHTHMLPANDFSSWVIGNGL
jgi:hypothetical protein